MLITNILSPHSNGRHHHLQLLTTIIVNKQTHTHSVHLSAFCSSTMASPSSSFFFFFFFFFFLSSLLPASTVSLAVSNNTYIVYMHPSHKPSVHPSHAHWYASHLQSLSIDPASHLLYSYSSLHGFAAHLLPKHLDLLRRSPAVLHFHPDPLLRLHTTRSPRFLGLLGPADAATTYPIAALDAASHDVIVAILDTGVWPESPSFNDAAMPPVPTRWRGECEAGVDFSPSVCNRKLIGARSFSRGFRAAAGMAYPHIDGIDDVSVVFSGEGDNSDKPKEYASPRDRDGHGTHTASTAAGAAVANASLLGFAAGTARGMATGARVAAYKVCWAAGCFGSDILAGMDAAISDGADVLSLSLGGGAAPYFRDTIAVGAFAAVARGVFVSCSAGNSGPGASTLANIAPWITTVGAGTLDRDFPAYATLSTGEKLTGVSLYAGKGMGRRMAPLLYGETAAAPGVRVNSSSMCLAGALDPARVKGKIVLCDRGISARVEKGAVVKAAGGVGMILANTAANGEELVADAHLLPAVAVGKKDGDRIRQYVLKSSRNAKAVLSFGGTVLGIKPSPVVAAFSSRGPNTVSPEVLKPDLIGPGVNILAGWSESVGPTGLAKDRRRTQFNIMSGTSMSCPHISGIAALIKAAHPHWSPSAIKSAMMTTAYTVDNTGSSLLDAGSGLQANSMSYGAGHVDPKKALSPGLIYDISTEDYISFLCSLNYTIGQIQAISKFSNTTCRKKFSDPGDLNYPSFSVVFDRKSRRVVKYRRELTNVGQAGSVYTVKVDGPPDIGVIVKPLRLVFKKAGQKLKYSVTFVSRRGGNPTNMAFGWITWGSKQHQVKSPIAYKWSKL